MGESDGKIMMDKRKKFITTELVVNSDSKDCIKIRDNRGSITFPLGSHDTDYMKHVAYEILNMCGIPKYPDMIGINKKFTLTDKHGQEFDFELSVKGPKFQIR